MGNAGSAVLGLSTPGGGQIFVGPECSCPPHRIVDFITGGVNLWEDRQLWAVSRGFYRFLDDWCEPPER